MFINIKMSVCNAHTEHDVISTLKQGVYNLTQWETPVELCILITQFKKLFSQMVPCISMAIVFHGALAYALFQ